MQTSRRGFLALAVFLRVSASLRGIDLDQTFGRGGKAVTSLGFGGEMAGFAIQADGKILVAGGQSVSGGTDIVLARYTVHGILDATFGPGGFARTTFSQSLLPSAAALQSDGKLVVAGSLFNSPAAIFAARFLPDGNLDAAFGTGGLAVTGFPSLDATGRALAIQADGRIIVAGSAGTAVPLASDFAAVRYNPDGTLDPGFGVGGRLIVDLGGTLPEWATGVVVEADGRVVLGGLSNAPGGNGFAMAGLLPDGSLDAAFGTGGLLLLTIGSSSGCDAVALDRDGKILAAGGELQGSVEDLAVVRLTASGALDPAFGSGGLSRIPVAASVNSITTDAARRIVIAASNGDFVLARVLPDGTPDAAIGPGGWTAAHFGNDPPLSAQASSVKVQVDGAIVIGGIQYLQTAGSLTSFALARYGAAASPIPILTPLALAALAVILGILGAIAVRRAG